MFRALAWLYLAWKYRDAIRRGLRPTPRDKWVRALSRSMDAYVAGIAAVELSSWKEVAMVWPDDDGE